MGVLQKLVGGAVVAVCASLCLGASAADRVAVEDYVAEPMPPGFKVVVSPLEGPVFADPRGLTLYKWPRRDLRNGSAGEVQGKPTCDDTVTRENAGLMSPYPGGFELPELDTRPSCAAAFPPVLASADSKPVGRWTIVDRPDGRKQWAFEGWSLYTSALDSEPGQVYGGSLMDAETDLGLTGAVRRPITPKPNIPSQFSIYTTVLGRRVELADGFSVYAFNRDKRHKSNCYEECLDQWEPIVAPAYARSVGEWTTFERSPGVKQWAFRSMPLYRQIGGGVHGQEGSDMPGWQNVYTQQAPAIPKGLTLNDSPLGTLLGDERGMTLYRYICTDDSVDQLYCDYPGAPQAYRLAICGGMDIDRCLQAFPYAVAPVGTKKGNTVWGTMYVDPRTGKKATANDPGALNVWTYRGRPLFTFAGRNNYGDKQPGDTYGGAWGEWMGRRNGFNIIVFRSPFSRFY